MPKKAKKKTNKKSTKKKTKSTSKKTSKKSTKKKTKKTGFELDFKKHGWYLLIPMAAILAIIILLIVNLSSEVTENPTEDKDIPYESDYFINEFDCTGKNTFQDDCFRKIQFYPEEEVHYITKGEELVIYLAIKNVDEKENLFSYSVNSLLSPSLQREGCPTPKDAESFIFGESKGEIIVSPDEIKVNELKIKAPSEGIPAAGCGYLYVVDVKKAGSFYERDKLQILIG